MLHQTSLLHMIPHTHFSLQFLRIISHYCSRLQSKVSLHEVHKNSPRICHWSLPESKQIVLLLFLFIPTTHTHTQLLLQSSTLILDTLKSLPYTYPHILYTSVLWRIFEDPLHAKVIDFTTAENVGWVNIFTGQLPLQKGDFRVWPVKVRDLSLIHISEPTRPP